jgi:hypothetical protein
MLEWSINVIKQLDISSKFRAFISLEEFFSQSFKGSGSSKTSSKLNIMPSAWGVRGVDGVAGSQDLALRADDSENLLRKRFVPVEGLLAVDSLCDFRRPLTS